MALTICMECYKEVSTKAATCPHCGAKLNDSGIIGNAIGVVVVCGILFILGSAIFGGSNDSPSGEQAPTSISQNKSAIPASVQKEADDAVIKAKADAECLLDLQCAGSKYTATVDTYCREMLETQAKFLAKWDYKIEDSGFFNHLFDKLKWANNSTKQQIIYFGDKAKFQNGFGAWQRMGYSCSFDIATKKPLAAWFDSQTMPENAISALPPEAKQQQQQELQSQNSSTQSVLRNPSFDCSRAKSTTEQLICGDDDLASLDRELAGLLAQAKQESSEKQKLLDQTRTAWNWREKNCRDKECLLRWYADRKTVYTTALQEPQSRDDSRGLVKGDIRDVVGADAELTHVPTQD